MWWRLALLLLLAAASVQGKSSCDEGKISASRLAATCCQLTRPSLDSSYAECRQRMQLPPPRRGGAGGQSNFSTLQQYAINMCIEECSYLASGYIDIDPPFVLDLPVIMYNLREIMPQPQHIALPFMLRAYAMCGAYHAQHQQKLKVHAPDLAFIEEPCNPFPLEVTVCVRIHAMQHCPAHFYSNSSQCQEAREFFSSCLEDLQANAVIASKQRELLERVEQVYQAHQAQAR